MRKIKHIYLAERTDGANYDEYERVCVVHYTMKDARKIAKELFENEPFKIKTIGIALDNIKTGVIISDYKNG